MVGCIVRVWQVLNLLATPIFSILIDALGYTKDIFYDNLVVVLSQGVAKCETRLEV